MDINEATAKAISAERAIAGLTIRELAVKSGIPLTSLQRVLSAEREIKINQIALIATALDVYPHEIVENAEKILDRETRVSHDVKLPQRGLSVVADRNDVALAATIDNYDEESLASQDET